jgi:hypothetical protein
MSNIHQGVLLGTDDEREIDDLANTTRQSGVLVGMYSDKLDFTKQLLAYQGKTEVAWANPFL